MNDPVAVPTIVLDPYLLCAVAMPEGRVSACQQARFVVSDHLSPFEFPPKEYKMIRSVVARENVELIPVPATELADLLRMRHVLVLHQIAAIATARHHDYLFASGCGIFQRMARTVLNSDRIVEDAAVRHLLSAN